MEKAAFDFSEWEIYEAIWDPQSQEAQLWE